MTAVLPVLAAIRPHRANAADGNGGTVRASGVKRTTADLLREALADRIVHGFMRPGEPLNETDIAAEFGVSRTPVREALRQLEVIGLAASRPHRGAIVSNPTDAELDEAFFVMAELEALCAKLCATAMSPADKDALVALHEAGAVYVQDAATDGFRLHNERFHNALYDGAGNAFLEDITRGVRQRVAPFRKMQFELERRIDQSQREHARVVQKILDGDGDGAATQMRVHIAIVRDKVSEATPDLV